RVRGPCLPLAVGRGQGHHRLPLQRLPLLPRRPQRHRRRAMKRSDPGKPRTTLPLAWIIHTSSNVVASERKHSVNPSALSLRAPCFGPAHGPRPLSGTLWCLLSPAGFVVQEVSGVGPCPATDQSRSRSAF